MVKPGVRALGIAESYSDRTSTLSGVVVSADRVVDGFAFDQCTVGGRDATSAIRRLFDSLDRPDVRYLLVSGIAPAWFNIVDLDALHEATDRPVVAVTYEDSEGLESAIREAFDGDARSWRLEAYRALPERRPVDVGDETVFVRSVGMESDEAADVVRGFTPEGGRPEPLRVARLAARAADAFRDADRPERE